MDFTQDHWYKVLRARSAVCTYLRSSRPQGHEHLPGTLLSKWQAIFKNLTTHDPSLTEVNFKRMRTQA